MNNIFGEEDILNVYVDDGISSHLEQNMHYKSLNSHSISRCDDSFTPHNKSVNTKKGSKTNRSSLKSSKS